MAVVVTVINIVIVVVTVINVVIVVIKEHIGFRQQRTIYISLYISLQ